LGVNCEQFIAYLCDGNSLEESQNAGTGRGLDMGARCKYVQYAVNWLAEFIGDSSGRYQAWSRDRHLNASW